MLYTRNVYGDDDWNVNPRDILNHTGKNMIPKYEIVERSSGYWIVDSFGYLNGPYDTVEEASQDVPKGQLQYPLELGKKVLDTKAES
jgi:hypothetical protein